MPGTSACSCSCCRCRRSVWRVPSLAARADAASSCRCRGAAPRWPGWVAVPRRTDGRRAPSLCVLPPPLVPMPALVPLPPGCTALPASLDATQASTSSSVTAPNSAPACMHVSWDAEWGSVQAPSLQCYWCITNATCECAALTRRGRPACATKGRSAPPIHSSLPHMPACFGAPSTLLQWLQRTSTPGPQQATGGGGPGRSTATTAAAATDRRQHPVRPHPPAVRTPVCRARCCGLR